MARIPEPEIERLKQEISLQRLAESAGIALNVTELTYWAYVRSTMTKPRHW